MLDTMQQEIAAGGWPVPVQILGVNAVGHESSNAAACEGRDIPWLQETPAQPAWATWQVTYRDVIILDETNMRVGVYNLTTHDLAEPAYYAELKALLRTAAGAR